METRITLMQSMPIMKIKWQTKSEEITVGEGFFLIDTLTNEIHNLNGSPVPPEVKIEVENVLIQKKGASSTVPKEVIDRVLENQQIIERDINAGRI